MNKCEGAWFISLWSHMPAPQSQEKIWGQASLVPGPSQLFNVVQEKQEGLTSELT